MFVCWSIVAYKFNGSQMDDRDCSSPIYQACLLGEALLVESKQTKDRLTLDHSESAFQTFRKSAFGKTK